jgi:ribose 5-phosphate isomerase A
MAATMQIDLAKRAVGYAAVDRYVRTGTCIGLGTGSTAHWAIVRVGERVAAGETIVAVPTSLQTEALCREHGIPIVGLCEQQIDVGIDGADEVAADWSLTKGGGGAQFREKAVALAAARFVVIVTPEKLVDRLGAFPTPVEVVPFTELFVTRELQEMFPDLAVRRRGGATPFLTDNGNMILDCAFGSIDDPAALDAQIRAVHGVLATGLFTGLASTVLVGEADGAVRELVRPPGAF